MRSFLLMFCLILLIILATYAAKIKTTEELV